MEEAGIDILILILLVGQNKQEDINLLQKLLSIPLQLIT